MRAALFRRILVPHDFSSQAAAALAIAVDLAAEHRGTIAVLHAIAPVYPITSFGPETALPVWAPPEEMIAAARTRLEALVARARKRRGVRAVTCRVLVGEPHRCIAEAARDADSIVMGTLGRTGLSHLLIGSVAEKVVRHAPVPVLTVRSGGGGPSRRRTRARRATRPAARRSSRARRR